MNPDSRIPGTNPVDALLFDLGGVVIDVDFERVFARWALHAACDSDLIKSAFRMDPFYERHERGEIDAAAYFASLRSSLGLQLTDAQFHDGWKEIFGGEIAGMVALLRRAADRLPVYAFTNTNAAHREVWSHCYPDVVGVFQRVFVSCDLGKRKPDPAAFRAVAAAMGVAESRVLFFDDTPENIAGARATGMRAVHVRSVADVEKSLGTLI